MAQVEVSVGISGNVGKFVSLVRSVVDDQIVKDDPEFLIGLFHAVGSYLTSSDEEDAKFIGTALGLYVTERFGEVNHECDCAECTKRRRDNLKNVNIN